MEDDYDYDVENEDDLDAAFEEQNNEDDDFHDDMSINVNELFGFKEFFTEPFA